MRKLVMAALACVLLLGGTAGADTTPASPLISAAVTITLAAHNLTPGGRYEATFEALGSEDDPYGYYLGYSAQTVRGDGSIRFVIDLTDLTAYVPHLYEVKMWLRPVGSSVGAASSLDPQGRPLYVEQEVLAPGGLYG